MSPNPMPPLRKHGINRGNRISISPKLRRDGISDKGSANKTHHEIGTKIRKTIAEFGNTMPEDLPIPEQSIKQLETKKRKELKRLEGSI